MKPLTLQERATLTYLTTRPEATAREIGIKIAGPCPNPGMVGGSVCGMLRKRGLVAYVNTTLTWFITDAGREALR